MIYLLLFLAATAIFLYVASRWLRGELRELRAWLGEKWVVHRGGESQDSAISRAENAFATRDLQMDFLIVSREIRDCHRELCREHVERTPGEPLPAAVVLALGADTNAKRLYLRTIVPNPAAPARDSSEFVDFGDVKAVATVPRTLDSHLPPAADQALSLDLGEDHPPYHLHLEAGWNISPNELTRRIRDLVAGQWHPDAPPTIVR